MYSSMLLPNAVPNILNVPNRASPWSPIGAPSGPMGPHGAPWGPMGAHGPYGAPWGPMGPWAPMGGGMGGGSVKRALPLKNCKMPMFGIFLKMDRPHHGGFGPQGAQGAPRGPKGPQGAQGALGALLGGAREGSLHWYYPSTAYSI